MTKALLIKKFNGFSTNKADIDPSLPYLVECCTQRSIIIYRLELEKEVIPFSVEMSPSGYYWIFIESKPDFIEKAIAIRNRCFQEGLNRLRINPKHWKKDRFERLLLVNQILPTLAPGFHLEKRPNGFYLSWEHWKTKETISKRVCLERNHYFTFDLPTGGTCTNAIAMLVRYARNQSVFPLSTWKYWASDTILMWRDPVVRDRCLLLLEESDWPRNPHCIFCDRDLTGRSWDWYSWKGSSLEGIGCAPYDPEKCPAETRSVYSGWDKRKIRKNIKSA
jgi:hypothetical protein